MRCQERDGVTGVGKWGGGVPIQPGVWWRVMSSPSGVRVEKRPKMNLVHFICYRILLVEEKSSVFIDTYSDTNEPTIGYI